MDRRAALEASWDKAEAEDTPEETNETVELEKDPPLEAEAPEKEAPAGEKGDEPEARAVGDAGEKEEKKPEKEEKPRKDEALGRAAQAASSQGTGAESKAPISWKPAAKEQWAKLPVDIRQEVMRREAEISKYISQNDHHRKFTEGFGNVVRPFAHLIQAQGSTPLQAVRNLFTTTAGLMTGNSEQKARIVAEIIGNYGVDVATLDKVLSGGQIPAVQNAPAALHPSVLQALQPVYGFMSDVQKAKQEREQRQMQEAEDLVSRSSDLPYFDDLREDMADLMDIAAKRGVELTIPQAYEKAVALNPEISAIIARQKAIEEARKNGGTRLARARRAASTLTGAPSGSPDGKTAPKSRREVIEAAWEERTEH